jgi:nitrogen regulatory protein PII-like uncharacterized protein
MNPPILSIILGLALIFTACAKRDIAPIDSNLTTVKKSLPTISYTIQLGAFTSSKRAERLVKILRKKGVDAFFYEDKSGLTKVRFGRFNTNEKAQKYAIDLKAKGIIDSFYIVKPKYVFSLTHKKIKEDPRKALGRNLINTAKQFIGIPYRWGGESVTEGFDCSGLTMTVYRLNGMELPRKASMQYLVGQPVSRRSLKRGDLVFFATNGGSRISHVGIYSGDNKFIHAPGRGKTIRTSSLSNVYFKKHYQGARRYF